MFLDKTRAGLNMRPALFSPKNHFSAVSIFLQFAGNPISLKILVGGIIFVAANRSESAWSS